ncbi:MAG: 2-oxo acid dehydrogenase subunit E2 [Actinomycetota bacterium]|nr:2-oxo acid dehydrogenase subunit E2 [Actinomycetota bacterium]
MQNEIKNPYEDNPIIEERRLRGSRRVISKILLDSYQNKIHATMFKYLEIRKLRDFISLNKEGSLVDHFIRAVALSLKDKPELNATYDGEVHRIFKDINISYAINTPRGLVTPVIKNADKLTLEEFYSQRKKLVSLVMDWQHEKKDIIGGTFTISNLGNYGVDLFSAIINPPQVAILSMARAFKQNIAWDLSEEPTLKELLPISLTFDHSIIDGSGAAEFLKLLQNKINEPENLWNNV